MASACTSLLSSGIRRVSGARLGMLAAGVLLALPAPAHAARLFGVISERSASELSAGAHAFASAHPEHSLVLRTTEQLAALSDAELEALWSQADAIFIGAAFGEQAQRLDRLFAAAPPRAKTFIAVHSDSATGLVARSRLRGEPVFDGLSPRAAAELASALVGAKDGAERARLARAHPRALRWFEAERFYAARGGQNFAALIAWLLSPWDASIHVPEPRPVAAVRFLRDGRELAPGELAGDAPSVALLDYEYGDRAGDAELHARLCAELAERGLSCFSVLSRWGDSSIEALETLVGDARRGAARLSAVVLLQDFVVGGGSDSERAGRALSRLGVPVIKGIRLSERDGLQWELSEDGLPQDSVHYRIAMPELQGAGQPFVIATAGAGRTDPTTGIALRPLEPVDGELSALAARCARWAALQTKPNADKRVAIVYYNHPPGRHNIGADNLDVPASLLEITDALTRAGYDVGPRPHDAASLVSLLQERGVNLPEDGPALARMAERVATVASEDYARYFASLPEALRLWQQDGPLGALAPAVRRARQAGHADAASSLASRVLGDVRHMLEGADHPARDRGLALLAELEAGYAGRAPDVWREIERLTRALQATGIEGLGGWGAPPGRVMTRGDRLLVPGVTFGKVFLGPQPPRGWELDEELLHANLAFAPPHQYLAFYHYLRDVFAADVIVHVGRHSTYEFLPGRRVGLGAGDFSRAALGDLPSVYIYIVDGVGEGIQAKRRGHAVIVDHLTPSLATTPLYDDLLELRQLVESFETAAGNRGQAADRAVGNIRRAIDRLDLRKELTASMQGELAVRGIGFDEVDDELLVHEVGHYLTAMQERFMPYGLHTFGRAWKKPAVDRMLRSMAGDGAIDPAWRERLVASPRAERAALLAGLDGRFIAPGPGNDPIRTPAALPTGRNFHALDSSVLPTRMGYELGAELAASARRDEPGSAQGAEAVVLWASDTVRDEGAMIGFGLDMLGVKPVWNSRGIVQGLERVALDGERVRRDTTFVTSGLFRDLYGNLLQWLDRAVLLALDASSTTIRAEHPTLAPALAAALEPLGDLARPGDEALSRNQLAAHWVQDVERRLAAGENPASAGRGASLRLFGNAPGGYGAGINRLAERSGAWQERSELAEAYVHRMGHAYGVDRAGEPAHASFSRLLGGVEHTYLGRASNLYGLLDNNDGFDYLGGLGMAVERARGSAPLARVIQHADPAHPRMDRLPVALMQELRGRHLNPAYLKPLMEHGYAGARTMGSEFFENLWGWQVTSPEIVDSWVWDEVKAVYLDDRHGIGLDEFLERDHNVHVKTNMEAILLVAAHKKFWDVPQATLDALARSFARHVVEHGLPGSGHTRPDHPMMTFVAARLEPELRRRFEEVLERSKLPETAAAAVPTTIAEIEPENKRDARADGGERARLVERAGLVLLCLALALFAFGVTRGRMARSAGRAQPGADAKAPAEREEGAP